jgi:hypothetical protein
MVDKCNGHAELRCERLVNAGKIYSTTIGKISGWGVQFKAAESHGIKIPWARGNRYADQ